MHQSVWSVRVWGNVNALMWVMCQAVSLCTETLFQLKANTQEAMTMSTKRQTGAYFWTGHSRE